MSLGLLVLRLVVGSLFIGHGAQKLFGSFGGHGLAGTGAFFDGLGLRPGRHHALAAGLAEFGGGALLALGLITPIAAAIVIAVMTVAIITVHFSKGLWVTNGGFEYNLTLATVAFALAGVGPGRWSLDHVIGLSDHGALWAIGALVVGVVGGLGAVVSARTLGSREAAGPRPSAA
jgi:putative oxidoreductase